VTATELIPVLNRLTDASLTAVHAAEQTTSLTIGQSSDPSLTDTANPQELMFGEQTEEPLGSLIGEVILDIVADGTHRAFQPINTVATDRWIGVGVDVMSDDFPELWLVSLTALPRTVSRNVRGDLNDDVDTDADSDPASAI
jgi:hypothetical protein